MINISYSFYTDTYGGSLISSENFNFIRDRAIGIVNNIVTVDLFDYDGTVLGEELETRLKKAICAAADVTKSATQSDSPVSSGIVQSESISGAWSKTYAVSSNPINPTKQMHADIRCVLEDYLSGTDLIFRGYYLHV